MVGVGVVEEEGEPVIVGLDDIRVVGGGDGRVVDSRPRMA